jgi:hypothetical protein
MYRRIIMPEYGHIHRLGDRALFQGEKRATLPELAHLSNWIDLLSPNQGLIVHNISECFHKGPLYHNHYPDISSPADRILAHSSCKTVNFSFVCVRPLRVIELSAAAEQPVHLLLIVFRGFSIC